MTPLTLPPGIVSDNTTFDATGRWSDANHVRFVEGRPETRGGWTKAYASALTGVCRGAYGWTDNVATRNLAFGTTSKLYVFRNSLLYDITPAGLDTGLPDAIARPGYGEGGYGLGPYGGGPLANAYPRTWSMANYGENLIACPRGGKIYQWPRDILEVATEVSGAPDYNIGIVVTPQRQLIACGTTEEVSGEFNAMCIRGTDIQDITDWTTASDNNAFEHILEGGGQIVAGKIVGDYLVIWTDTGLHLGQYLGLPGQTYKFDYIASDCGLAGPLAGTVADGIAYWLTPDLQFYSWYPGSLPQPIFCPISEDFADNIDLLQIDKVVASAVSEFGEIMWFFPDERDGDENSRYVCFSVSESRNAGQPVWSRGQQARTAFIDSGPQRYPVGVDASGYIYWHENGNDADGAAMSWFIESNAFYIGNGERRTVLRGCWPDFKAQQGNITMTVSSRDWPQSTAQTEKTVTLSTATMKSDFMCEGRLFTLKFSASAAPTFARFGKPLFDAKAGGMF